MKEGGKDMAGVLAQFWELANVIRVGHFPLTSGRHSQQYFDKRVLYADERITRFVCKQIAVLAGGSVQVVVGPQEGGFTVAKFVAEQLSILQLCKIQRIPAYKTASGFEFSRYYRRLLKDKKVLVVDDVLTTGGTISKVIRLVRNYGGEIIGVGVICNREGVTQEKLGVPWLYPVVSLYSKSFDPKDCPLCKEGVPLDQKPSGH